MARTSGTVSVVVPVLLVVAAAGAIMKAEVTVTSDPRPRQPATADIQAALKSLPLSFIENRGQLDPRVSYYVKGTTTSVYFTSGGITFSLSGGEPSEASSPKLPGERTLPAGWARLDLEGGTTERYTLKLDFVGADPDVTPVGTERAAGLVSYFTGPQEDWHTGLPTFSSITYPDLWPGIDLVYSGTGSALKYTFHVAPGADPSQIRLAYRGATSLEMNETGALEVGTPITNLTEQAPYTYQQTASEQVEVASTYTLDRATATFGFDLGDYEPTQPLVIDPVVIVYAGFIGGAGTDYGYAVAVDAAGNAYVTGRTDSKEGSFPVKVGPDLTYNENGDAFVAKVRASGQALVYAGYIGGAESDHGYDVAVDEEGNAYVTGWTFSDEGTFPVVGGPDLTFNGGMGDGFVAKVEASGETLAYAGYIGGVRSDYGLDVVVDGAGDAYVSGSTFSNEDSFPVKVGPDLTYNGNGDAFVAKVEALGETLAYAGYIGGAEYEFGSDAAVDGSGNAYVTGYTYSSEESFPVRVGPDLTFNGGDADAFVAKVAASGKALAYAGYIGGRDDEDGYGVAVDEAGNVYVTGSTSSNEDSFPVKVGPDLTFNGLVDAFVAKVEASGQTLAYAGYIGGSGWDEGRGLALDGPTSAYVTGFTYSSEESFPVVVGPDLSHNGGTDAFIAKISSDEDPGPGCTITGTSGDDVIEGSDGEDVICAKAGDDRVSARTGNDEVLGGGGHDTLVGDGGSDILRGGTGDDVLRTADGIEGNDEAWGGPGDDVCVVDPGDETFGCEEVLVSPLAPRIPEQELDSR